MATGSYLPDLSHDDLTEKQREVFPYLESQIAKSFSIIQSKNPSTNQLLGPFGIFLHSPDLARLFFDTSSTLTRLSAPYLPAPVREVAILTVGVYLGAEYEIYAHGLIAIEVGVGRGVVEELKKRCGKEEVGEGDGDMVVEGLGLDEKQRVAFEVARWVVGGRGGMERGLWERGVGVLGREGMFFLVQFVGYYCWVCGVLNGFGARVPKF